ncbi:MAG: hypothetical protein UV73_C0016G0016 [Candidatus Gottesmanbacteria bacterium GW2011_GWA2_43_14]|uniref:Probable pectate lyase C n=1 Tax=Candidatus Gottesmanbacteria bacterium GW2011_GWA2_43_14 TaxID=1618443 RepID=A0A0G1DCK4_9BACT|nr:MAG: hypothetical protein UV73_C0016G0016 [Candidatus Gottesmanbacteria bacterium GW2011_GWA2_43_14]
MHKFKVKIISISLAVTLFYFLSAHAVQAATLRVPQNYSTIQSAVNAAATGDIILVAPGTYHEEINLNKGITLAAEQYDSLNPRNNQTVIDAGGGSGGVINIPQGLNSQPKISGFWLRNAVSGTLAYSPFIIEFCYLTAAGDLGEYEKGSGGISRNNIYEGGGDDGIDLDHQIKPILIENNLITKNSQDGIEIRLQDDSIAQAVDIIIKNNRLELNGDGGGGDGIQIIDYQTDTNRRFTIERNLIIDNKQAGLGLMDNEDTSEDFRAASIREQIRVINNTFSGNDHGISGGDNLLALNNIFANNKNLALKNVDNKSQIAYNLFWNNGTDFTGSNVDLLHMLKSDPKLTAGFQLQPGSPAVDAGTSAFTWTSLSGETVNIALPPSEFTGSRPDLGRYETQGSVIPSPTGMGKPGDANGNGKVDGLDYVIWLNNYNKTVTNGASSGDFNNSGKVDGLDYVIWLNNYNK